MELTMVSFIRFLEAMYSVGLASRRAILLPSGIASLLSKPSQTQKMKLVWLVGICKSQFQLLSFRARYVTGKECNKLVIYSSSDSFGSHLPHDDFG